TLSPPSYTTLFSLHDPLPIYVFNRPVIEVEPEVSRPNHLDALRRSERRRERRPPDHHDVAADRITAQTAARDRLSGLRIEVVKRSEEHTSELQSHLNVVCGLL